MKSLLPPKFGRFDAVRSASSGKPRWNTYTWIEVAKDSRISLTGYGAVMFADYDVFGNEIEEARALLKEFMTDG